MDHTHLINEVRHHHRTVNALCKDLTDAAAEAADMLGRGYPDTGETIAVTEYADALTLAVSARTEAVYAARQAGVTEEALAGAIIEGS